MAIRTTIDEIVKYWSARVYEGDLGTDWDEGDCRCWRCGVKKKHGALDRCHIMPEQEPFCGPDHPSNLILLCKSCHAEAPSVTDPNAIWKWIKATRSTTYESLWADRAMELREKMYGPIGEVEPFDVISVAQAFEKCGVGLQFFVGDSRITSVGTEAWKLQQLIDAMKRHRLTNPELSLSACLHELTKLLTASRTGESTQTELESQIIPEFLFAMGEQHSNRLGRHIRKSRLQ